MPAARHKGNCSVSCWASASGAARHAVGASQGVGHGVDTSVVCRWLSRCYGRAQTPRRRVGRIRPASSAICLLRFRAPANPRLRRATPRGVSPKADRVIQEVLAMLHEPRGHGRRLRTALQRWPAPVPRRRSAEPQPGGRHRDRPARRQHRGPPARSRGGAAGRPRARRACAASPTMSHRRWSSASCDPCSMAPGWRAACWTTRK